MQSFRRRTDASIVGLRRIPRVKVEYQIARPIFVRVVGEYNSDWQDDLRDDSRTNLPIYILNRATGAYQRAVKQDIKSYTLANLDEDPRTARLRRTADGFFLKLS